MEASGIHQKEVPSGGDTAGDAQEGVGHGMKQGIAIGMAYRSKGVIK